MEAAAVREASKRKPQARRPKPVKPSGYSSVELPFVGDVADSTAVTWPRTLASPTFCVLVLTVRAHRHGIHITALSIDSRARVRERWVDSRRNSGHLTACGGGGTRR